MIVKVLLLCLLIAETASLMCYQCRDSSGEPGKNRCGKWVRTMNKYRQKHLETGRIDLPYVKDCTGFNNLSDSQLFCALMKVELGGNIRTYIRGCSDGRDFFSADYNTDIQKYVLNDNQTYCIYTGQGYVACATICDTDFCNGFVSGAGRFDISFWFLLVMCMAMLYRNYDTSVV